MVRCQATWDRSKGMFFFKSIAIEIDIEIEIALHFLLSFFLEVEGRRRKAGGGWTQGEDSWMPRRLELNNSRREKAWYVSSEAWSGKSKSTALRMNARIAQMAMTMTTTMWATASTRGPNTMKGKQWQVVGRTLARLVSLWLNVMARENLGKNFAASVQRELSMDQGDRQIFKARNRPVLVPVVELGPWTVRLKTDTMPVVSRYEDWKLGGEFWPLPI